MAQAINLNQCRTFGAGLTLSQNSTALRPWLLNDGPSDLMLVTLVTPSTFIERYSVKYVENVKRETRQNLLKGKPNSGNIRSTNHV
ncbi:MAG TPA: hypothetical protein DC054_25305 [Blastocatellia bacterium]|nr:hypothetical protein [Blastocatellia bacterium]